MAKMQSGRTKERASSNLLARAFKRQRTWDDKEELLDIIYWIRQIIAVVIGLVWGAIPFYGVIGILSFFALNVGIVYIYHAYYHRVDEEEFGGLWELVKEGMMTSFALFLIVWIMCYTLLRFG